MFKKITIILTKKEKTSDIAMRHNVVLAINWIATRFNKKLVQLQTMDIYGIIKVYVQ